MAIRLLAKFQLPSLSRSLRSRWASGGWVVSSELCHIGVPSCKQELARCSALLKQDGAECGNYIVLKLFQVCFICICFSGMFKMSFEVCFKDIVPGASKHIFVQTYF